MLALLCVLVMPVAWSGTDDNGASWKLYEPDGKQQQAVNYGTGNGKVKVQLRTGEFDRFACGEFDSEACREAGSRGP